MRTVFLLYMVPENAWIRKQSFSWLNSCTMNVPEFRSSRSQTFFKTGVQNLAIQENTCTGVYQQTLALTKTSFAFVLRYIFKDKSSLFNHTSSQDVLKTTNKFVLVIRLQDSFKTSSRRLQNVFKTYCKDVFKMYHQAKLYLLTLLLVDTGRN